MDGLQKNKTPLQIEAHQHWLCKMREQLEAAASRNETAERYTALTAPQRKAVFVLGNALAEECTDHSMQKLEGKDIFAAWQDLTLPQRRTVARGMESIRYLAHTVPARYRPGDIVRLNPDNSH